MSSCNLTQTIAETECIGDSLVKINSNFSNLDTATCSLSSSLSDHMTNGEHIGSVVQIVRATFTDTSDGIAAIIPIDNTPPLITEGAELISQTITLKNSANKVYIHLSIQASSNTAGFVVAVFKGSTCLGANFATNSGWGWYSNTTIDCVDLPSASSATYTVRAGAASGSGIGSGTTLLFNDSGSGHYKFSLGGLAVPVVLTLTEVSV